MRRILWGRDTSSNVMKVIWLLEELKLPYERMDVGGAFGKTDTPSYRAMNPTGLVPTLQEDEFSMWESNAIMRYICMSAAGDLPYYPDLMRQRGRIDQWLDCQQTQLNRPMGVVFWGMVRTKPADRDAAALAQGVADAGRIWGFLEEPLSRHNYIAGDQLSIADIAWGVHVHRWFTMEIDRPPAPQLRAWYDRLLKRPVYKAHIARPLV
ncbi:MAG: glutathione S-transferase family protein [Alphaproteobacteria bacterium]|nr:glutathione S-transferase family protein [Alphaproteobacteria bacterium]